MKSLLILPLSILCVNLCHAEEAVFYYQEDKVYAAIDSLSEYIKTKDDNFNRSQIYNQILENVEHRGLQAALLKPLDTLYSLEENVYDRARLEQIYQTLGVAKEAPESWERPKKKPFVPRDNIGMVSSESNQCVGSCIKDILEGAAAGATIGVSVGTAGGPAVAGGAAAGGAIVGGALGGVACSTRPECKRDENKKIKMPEDFDLGRNVGLNLEQLQQQKYDFVVNDGPRHPWDM